MTTRSGIRIPSVLVTRPTYEVEMFGGPNHVEIKVGTMVRVHPAHDLFMRGAKFAEVRRIRDCCGVVVFDVRPYVGGAPIRCKLVPVRSDDVLVDEKGIGVE